MMPLRLFGRLNAIIGFIGKIRLSIVFVLIVCQILSTMYCILGRSAWYVTKKVFWMSSLLICIIRVHVFVCCLLWQWPCLHFRLCSHGDRDGKTTGLCVFQSQPLKNISFLFLEQYCMECSCNSDVGGNSFGSVTNWLPFNSRHSAQENVILKWKFEFDGLLKCACVVQELM